MRTGARRAISLNQQYLNVIYSDHRSDGTLSVVKRLVTSDIDGWIIRSSYSDKARHSDEVSGDGEINEDRIYRSRYLARWGLWNLAQCRLFVPTPLS